MNRQGLSAKSQGHMEWKVISKLLSGSVKYLASPTSALENYHVLNIHLLLAAFPVPHVIPGPHLCLPVLKQ